MPSLLPILMVPAALSTAALQQARENAGALATTLVVRVGFSVVDSTTHSVIEAYLSNPATDGTRRPLEMVAPVTANPMSSVPFVWLEDGTPNWEAMWESFCELALYGGPPHRGEESALTSPGTFGETQADFDAIAEIRRGIWATTGLFAEPAEPGWIAVTCESKRMAAWLCATIILENVEAWCRDERLYLPAAQSFSLKNEVKSVVTVLAKTTHYWYAHATRG